jgi:hypothetical protein
MTRWPWPAAAIAALALVGGVVAAARRHGTPPAPAGVDASAAQPGASRPSGDRSTITVTTDPAGASLSIDGQPAGVTPTTLSVDPATAPRLTFTLEGFHVREVTLVPHHFPAEVRIALETSGPRGAVAFTSAFPVDVSWHSQVLVRSETGGEIGLPVGSQSLTFVSRRHFMTTTVTVDVRPDATARISLPPLGRLTLRSRPEGCQVSIDGAVVGETPVLDKAAGVGTHVVSFRWPDGVERQQTVEVKPGAPAHVMGRRD